jgi:hypothetical protein
MTFLTVDHMPGPTQEARVLQHQQYAALDAMYEAWNAARAKHDFVQGAEDAEPAYIASKAAYEASVRALETLLGEDAPCNFVDADLWSAFSDCYKDDAGFRPRFHRTRQQVLDYFERRRKQTAVA